MKETATVKIFLAEGDPASVRTAEISNWTGKAVAGPRSRLELILQRNEANKPGIYKRRPKGAAGGGAVEKCGTSDERSDLSGILAEIRRLGWISAGRPWGSEAGGVRRHEAVE